MSSSVSLEFSSDQISTPSLKSYKSQRQNQTNPKHSESKDENSHSQSQSHRRNPNQQNRTEKRPRSPSSSSSPSPSAKSNPNSSHHQNKDNGPAHKRTFPRPSSSSSSLSRPLDSLLFQHREMSNLLSSSAASSSLLLPNSKGFIGMGNGNGNSNSLDNNRSWRVSQSSLLRDSAAITKSSRFDLSLPLYGPYISKYSSNGRHLLLGGQKGHLGLLTWENKKLLSEINVNETIRDVTFLHDHNMIAVAQKKYVHIYDDKGVELHCIRAHFDIHKMEFLPYHFLLATIGETGYLKYHDTSTGKLLCELRTKKGPCHVMKQNHSNAIIHLGHHDGTVSLWSPNMSSPLMLMKCHNANITAIDMDLGGFYMTTAGMDGKWSTWDLRTMKPLNTYFAIRPVSAMDISDTGILAMGQGNCVQLWQNPFKVKQKDPFLIHRLSTSHSIHSVSFCPYEDIIGIGHENGFSSLVVPGAGEPNFDSFEQNVFETSRQRRERIVHTLLEKIQPQLIQLDTMMVGKINVETNAQSKSHIQREQKSHHGDEKSSSSVFHSDDEDVPSSSPSIAAPKVKNKMRGGQKSSAQHRRRRVNVITQQNEERRDKIKHLEKKVVQRNQEENSGVGTQRKEENAIANPLDRFQRKKT